MGPVRTVSRMTTPTTLDELLQQGWARHDSHTAEVADQLEAHAGLVTDGEGASRFLHLALHAIGDHLGERERSAKLCEAVVKQLGDEAGTPPLIYLAVARRLSGDDEGAIAAQSKAGEDPAIGVRIGLLVAQGLMHGGDWDNAAALYRAQIASASTLASGHAAERGAAVASNSFASELMQLEQRTAAQDALMVEAADNAFDFWGRAGTWVNVERGHYLLTGVHHSLGAYAEAKRHAELGLAVIANGDGEQPVDEAFLHLARATACRDAGEADEQAASIAKAEALAADFEGEGLTAWFQDELAKAR